MAIRKTAFLPGLVVGLIFGASAATKADPNPAVDDPLRPLAWLVGGTWVAEFKDPKGIPVAIEVTYSWAAHKKSISYTHIAKSQGKAVPQIDGLCYWHPGKKHLAIMEVNWLGYVTEEELTQDDKTLRIQSLTVRNGGAMHVRRAEIVREGPDVYVFRGFMPSGNDWVEAFTARYKRVGAAK